MEQECLRMASEVQRILFSPDYFRLAKQNGWEPELADKYARMLINQLSTLSSIVMEKDSDNYLGD